MFGLPSFQKLLVLAAVIALVWYGFKFIGRLQEARKANAKLRESDPQRRKRPVDARDQESVEMVRDPRTGVYHPKGSEPPKRD